MTYIENIDIAIEEEIKILQARMEKRRLDITEMEIANEQDGQRVEGLTLAKSQLETAINTLKTLPGYDTDFTFNPKEKSRTRNDPRVPQRKIVTEILRRSSSALTHQQILNEVFREHSIRLNPRSLSTFLYATVREGTYSNDNGKFSLNLELSKDTTSNGEDAHSGRI